LAYNNDATHNTHAVHIQKYQENKLGVKEFTQLSTSAPFIAILVLTHMLRQKGICIFMMDASDIIMNIYIENSNIITCISITLYISRKTEHSTSSSILHNMISMFSKKKNAVHK